MNQPQQPTESRTRISLDVSPMILSHMDHIAEITGSSRSALLMSMLLDGLPLHLERADALQKRYRELNQQGKKK